MNTPNHPLPLILLSEGAPLSTAAWLKYIVRKLMRRVAGGREHGIDIRGPAAVRSNLIKGLEKLGYNFRYSLLNPKEFITPWVGVLSGPLDALPCAIRAKNSGKIMKLVAGPNLVTVPENHDGIIANPAIDIVVTPSKWVSDVYKAYTPELSSRLVEWVVGVDESFWFPINDEKRLDFLIFNKSFDKIASYQLVTITSLLDSTNLKYKILNYGEFAQEEYRAALQACRAMIYLGQTES